MAGPDDYIRAVKGMAAFGVYVASKAAVRSFVWSWTYRSGGLSHPLNAR